MPTATRKFVDCRETPSQDNCSLRISGTESEVLDTALRHAVASHGHTDTEEFRRQLRGALHDENGAGR